MIVAMTRIRNEELIIADSLQHMATFADGIIVYDDSSTDSTPEIVRASGAPVLEVIRGAEWSIDRQRAETEHREILSRAANYHNPSWLVYMDADERFTGDVRSELESTPSRVQAVRYPLLDAYLAPEARNPYTGGELSSLHRQYGPEVRHILMAWRPSRMVRYIGRDRREPVTSLFASVATSSIAVKHFGKGISEAQWEETCEYYVSHFPEPYRSKWALRRGKAIHSVSDFGRPLFEWPVPQEEWVNIDPSRKLSGTFERLCVALSLTP